MANAGPRQKANIIFGLSEIAEFKESPAKFQPAAAQVMPPGAPIGMGEIGFLDDYWTW
jgi:hypothetical protein